MATTALGSASHQTLVGRMPRFLALPFTLSIAAETPGGVVGGMFLAG